MSLCSAEHAVSQITVGLISSLNVFLHLSSNLEIHMQMKLMGAHAGNCRAFLAKLPHPTETSS